jgi:hypothetical protein
MLFRSRKPAFSISIARGALESNGASANAVAEQVKRCPSSALTFELLKKAD